MTGNKTEVKRYSSEAQSPFPYSVGIVRVRLTPDDRFCVEASFGRSESGLKMQPGYMYCSGPLSEPSACTRRKLRFTASEPFSAEALVQLVRRYFRQAGSKGDLDLVSRPSTGTEFLHAMEGLYSPGMKVVATVRFGGFMVDFPTFWPAFSHGWHDYEIGLVDGFEYLQLPEGL